MLPPASPTPPPAEPSLFTSMGAFFGPSAGPGGVAWRSWWSVRRAGGAFSERRLALLGVPLRRCWASVEYKDTCGRVSLWRLRCRRELGAAPSPAQRAGACAATTCLQGNRFC